MLDKALGKILFIDEAYRLADGADGMTWSFSGEAMDELVDCLTKPKYHQKMIVILAGYDEDMKRLMMVNKGLMSRFTETISFNSLGPAPSVQLMILLLGKKKELDLIEIDSAVKDKMYRCF